MIRCKVFKHILIPAVSLVAVDNKSKQSIGGECVCRPSELPIYTKDPPKKPEICSPHEPGAFEQTIGSIRRSIVGLTDQFRVMTTMVEDFAQQGWDTAECWIEYLQEEDNTTPKYGAVAVGALTGFIFGLRGRFFKRTLYASAGALGMAALCYPKEATEYSQIGISEGKKYATIMYNFIYGVKKDDPPLELPSLPKLPASLTEAWDTAKSLGKSSKSSVTDQGPDQEPSK